MGVDLRLIPLPARHNSLTLPPSEYQSNCRSQPLTRVTATAHKQQRTLYTFLPAEGSPIRASAGVLVKMTYLFTAVLSKPVPTLTAIAVNI